MAACVDVIGLARDRDPVARIVIAGTGCIRADIEHLHDGALKVRMI